MGFGCRLDDRAEQHIGRTDARHRQDAGLEAEHAVKAPIDSRKAMLIDASIGTSSDPVGVATASTRSRPQLLDALDIKPLQRREPVDAAGGAVPI